MILLDKPLISDFVKQSIRDGHFQALDTGNVIEPGEIRLLHDEDVIDNMRNNPAVNLHTTSENALKWIYDNLTFTGLPEKINMFKDKFAFRKLLSDMYPDFFFRKVHVTELDSIDISTFPRPFIIKPTIGFFSMGVHKVFDENDWLAVKEKIRTEIKEIRSIYPNEVLNLDTYIVEECISGAEYAFDAYFDGDGKAVVLGVLEHPFSGEGDVSDRVYNTSDKIVGANLVIFDEFLAQLQKRASLKNFSLHVEVRIDDTGSLVPIEVNPLRFGAWCTSADLTHYAFGFNPYAYYINSIKPDWASIFSASDESIYSIIILDNSTGYSADKIKGFNYDKLLSRFSSPLELRKIDYHEYPLFGILFTKTEPGNYGEIESILHSDLREYIIL